MGALLALIVLASVQLIAEISLLLKKLYAVCLAGADSGLPAASIMSTIPPGLAPLLAPMQGTTLWQRFPCWDSIIACISYTAP